jgi:hypothetical protein
MSYKPRHVAKLKTSSGKKKIEEEDLPLLHTPYSEVNASSTLLDMRGTPQLYFYALPDVAIPEMHNSDRIRNPKPSENHQTTLSVRTNPTSWTCSQPETLNPESSTSQQQQLTNAICSQPPTHICSHRNAHRKMRSRRREERVERKDRAVIQSSWAGRRFEKTPHPPIHGQASIFQNFSEKINLMS